MISKQTTGVESNSSISVAVKYKEMQFEEYKNHILVPNIPRIKTHL